MGSRYAPPKPTVAETPRNCYDSHKGVTHAMHTAIIGGGAAGMAAAIAAAEQGQRVTVLECGRKPLKKLGVTGNGRANLLNRGEPVYFGGEAFAKAVLAQMPCSALEAFFQAVGVPLREEGEGRVYPAALMASVVVDALLLRARQLGVTVVANARVTALERQGDGFLVRGVRSVAQDGAQTGDARASKQKKNSAAEPALHDEPLCLRCDRVIVAAGGAAAPAHGTEGTAYGLLTAFGHRLTPLSPALCALTTDPKRISGLAGQRVRATLRLLSPDGQTLRRAEGEALFAEDAVSGIAAMQLARFVQTGANVSLDLREAAGWADASLPDTDLPFPQSIGAAVAPVGGEAFATRAGCDASGQPSRSGDAASDSTARAVLARIRALAALRADCPLAELFTGVFTPPVARLLCREAGLTDPTLPLRALRDGDFQRLSAALCDLRLPVHGTRGFAQAQVTAGGVDTADFDPRTMESRLQKGLYAAGEVLNVDGDCGGFNLMFAFASGILAGRAGHA